MDPTQLNRRSKRDVMADAAAQAEFNEKRRVWIPDTAEGFLPGWIKSQLGDESSKDALAEVVVAATGEVRRLAMYTLSPMNPPQFDGVEDIADLTHLNEASVINNLKQRYGACNIYTYSGLFLISLNPYRTLPIYTSRIISQYRTKRKEENPPHIFAVAERAWQQIGEERESQSILITGESGAGKTENTKKVIQYLAAIASSTIPSEAESSSAALARSKSNSTAPATGLPRSSSFKGKEAQEIDYATNHTGLGLLERQILQANPILESFGNAQTMRNNNSSRFGKFIRIFFSPSGAIAGANIDWYLLEKSRVTRRSDGERCFHVFYQLLKGAKEAKLAEPLLLTGGPEDYEFLKKSRRQIDGVDDLEEWRLLKDALDVVGFTSQEQLELFRVPAMILHIGNLVLTGSGSDQAFFAPQSQSIAEKVCHLLGVPVQEFTKTVTRPKVKAGREWVTQSRTKKQAEDELGALCKFMYEKTFGWMVERINKALDRPSAKALSIGVLDIAGFEIFGKFENSYRPFGANPAVENSYEQLLINFTNEKLQQFFNFHMFTLEQEEYAREGIEWNYVNFGLDLQPTIELIESSQPVGILSTLDEECIMPKATDRTFTEKVQQQWETPRNGTAKHPGSAKFVPSRLAEGFTVKHYAGDVEYRTDGWLEKNKDPINDAVARLCAQSEVPAIASMFAEYAEETASTGVHRKVKRGAFRTVGQRHKEQLGQLMSQLSTTQPHFVRCIVPNSEKHPGKVEVNLVLDQLRCNGVLEGIRIARLGYPNRHSFAEFRQRYEVLTPGVLPPGYIDGRKAAGKIAEALELDKDFYKIGTTKIFFKAGVLAELEERRDNLLTDLFRRFQSAAKMHIARRRLRKQLNRSEAIRTIQRNARTYIDLKDWPWWSLYVKVRPLLEASKADSELAKKKAELAMAKERAERDEAEKKRLEELKATLLAEKSKIELDLSSERQLGRDRDEMLERSKRRESELLEKIAELEADLDVLGADREAAISEAAKTKDRLAQVTLDFEALVEQATMLEKQSTDWRKRESDLLRDTKDRSAAQSKLEMERANLERAVETLKRENAQKDDATRRTKERADMNILELEKRLQLEKGKSETGSTQMSALNDEIRALKGKHDDLQQLLKKHESTIHAKTNELANLERQRADTAKAQRESDQARTALQVKIDGLLTDLQGRERERADATAIKQKLERELDDLRKVMADKSSEDVRRKEADKSREAEMSRLREQVAAGEMAREEQQRKQTEFANSLRVKVEGLQGQHKAMEKELRAAQALLADKERDLIRVRAELDKLDQARRAGDKELATVRETLKRIEGELQTTRESRDNHEKQIHDLQSRYDDLEDAVIVIEEEKADWARRMESTGRQLMDESGRRQHLEQALQDVQPELASLRNALATKDREYAKAQSDIKIRDSEIALLRSRENKTIVEHVHVLEQAKKMTDRSLAEQIKANTELNSHCQRLEAKCNRLQMDLEDVQREQELVKKQQKRDARAARASLSPEDKDVQLRLAEETKARQSAEARAAALERDLQDKRKELSTAGLSAANAQAAEHRLAKKQEEVWRLEAAHEDLLAENERLQSQLAQAASRAAAPATPKMDSTRRAELLRGLQLSHDALGKDMSDQLRRLDAQPLTPSRRQNSLFGPSTENAHSATAVDPSTGKRVRALETEVKSLRNLLDNEREEKEFLAQRVQELEGKPGSAKPKLPMEQAMYSHFRLKAKSLRTQLDYWLAMEDLNAQGVHHGGGGVGGGELKPSLSGAPFAEDVQKLKMLLTQLDPDMAAAATGSLPTTTTR